MTYNEDQYKITDSQARSRLTSLFDEDSFNEIDAFAKSNAGAVEVVCGYGTVYGVPTYAFSQDVSVDGGAISKSQGEKIKKVYDLATKTGSPVVGIYDSNGVRLNEGFEALNAYGEMLKLANNISGVVPQISVVVGGCVGTSAIIAQSADFIIMSEDAQMYLAGSDEEITASDSLVSGVASLSAKDAIGAINMAKELISKLPMNNLSPAPITEFDEDISFFSNTCDAIKADTNSIIKSINDTDSTIELSSKFGTSVHTVIGTIGGSVVGTIGFNGQAINSHSCEKSCKFIRFCDAFNIPMLTLVNTDGFDKSITSQRGGILRYASQLSSSYADATSPKISLITGNAIGSAYLALAGRGANADLVYSWKCAVVSPLDPNAAVAILYNDRLAKGENREKLVAEYIATNASPLNAAATGQIDDIFEPIKTREKLISSFDILAGKRVTTLPKKHSVI